MEANIQKGARKKYKGFRVCTHERKDGINYNKSIRFNSYISKSKTNQIDLVFLKPKLKQIKAICYFEAKTKTNQIDF
jgi:hypothetical protein